MAQTEEKPKNETKRKSSSENEGCSGCLSIVVFVVEVIGYFLPG